jgi:hypothetical protein
MTTPQPKQKEIVMNTLPKEISADEGYGLPTTGMAAGLAVMFNDRLFDRCKQIAGYMAKAEGFTPPHLIGKSEACFAVVTRAITWRLDPFSVMQSTYQTPGGKVGYEGKLVQAILENSGHLQGPVTYELFGDWNRIRGKHKKAQSQRGGEYFAPDWKPEEEVGLGVIVRAQVKGEPQARELEFYLTSAWPRNSTLWALRPDQQIKYTACRAFGNTVAPGILMGVPFDTDADGRGTMTDVSPTRPPRSDFDAPQQQRVTQDPSTQAEGAAVEELINRETGEITGADAQELSSADAYQMGAEARDRGFALKAVPPEWRDDEHQSLADAWSDGWRSRDEEIRAALKGK